MFVAPKADVLRELLAAGADPNARLSNGNTPLHFAVRAPNPDFTSVLLVGRADPNARGDNKKPVIHVSTAFAGDHALELLVKGGANIDAVWAGKSALTAAVAGMTWRSAATGPRRPRWWGISAPSSLLEGVEFSLGGLGAGRAVDRPHRLGECLAVLPGALFPVIMPCSAHKIPDRLSRQYARASSRVESFSE